MSWTVRWAAIIVNQQTGAATLRATNMAVPDYGNFFNAISPNPDPPPRASHVSFESHGPVAARSAKIDDEVFDFSGRFVLSDATIAFASQDDGSGVVYRSNPEGQISFDSGVGRERNGVFH